MRKLCRERRSDQKKVTEFLVQDLDKWGKAISGARGIADDGLIWTVSVGINADHVCWYITFPRSSDEHLLRPCLYVLSSAIPVHKYSCPFYHQVYLQVPAKTTLFWLLHHLRISLRPTQNRIVINILFLSHSEAKKKK